MNRPPEEKKALHLFLVFACVFTLTELYFINIIFIAISVLVLSKLLYLPSALTEG
jgi:hypothetical protein